MPRRNACDHLHLERDQGMGTLVFICVSEPTHCFTASQEKEVSSPKKAFGLNSTICLDTLASCKHRAIVNSESLGVAVQQGSD